MSKLNIIIFLIIFAILSFGTPVNAAVGGQLTQSGNLAWYVNAVTDSAPYKAVWLSIREINYVPGCLSDQQMWSSTGTNSLFMETGYFNYLGSPGIFYAVNASYVRNLPITPDNNYHTYGMYTNDGGYNWIIYDDHVGILGLQGFSTPTYITNFAYGGEAQTGIPCLRADIYAQVVDLNGVWHAENYVAFP